MIEIDSPFFRLATDIMIVLDNDGIVVAANASASQKIRLSLEQIVGRPIFDFITDIAHERVRIRLKEKSVSPAPPFPLDLRVGENEVEITRAQFEYHPLEQRFFLVASPYIAMSEDENIRWQLALEGTDAGFWAWDITANVMYFSDRFETMLGYDLGELPLAFSTLRSLVHPDDVANNALFITPFLESRLRKFKFECRVRKKNGDYIWILTMGTRTIDSHGREFANGWHFDIDEQKRTEERLRKSEERSQLLLQSIPDLLFVFDRHGKYLEVQTSDPSNLIQPAETIVGTYVRDHFSAEFTELWLGYLNQVVSENKPFSAEYDIDVPAGHLYFEARLFPRADETVVAIIRDITAQKTAQAAAILSEERFNTFIRNCPATIFSFVTTPDGQGRYSYLAGRVLEMFGKSAEQMLGTPVFSKEPPFIYKDDEAGAMETMTRASESLEPVNWLGRFIMPSGQMRWINTIAAPSRNVDGSTQFNGISFDVTHERELADKLQEQQAMMSSSSRLTALGEMAGGIAHEINNPLTVAHAYASRLRDLAEAGKTIDAETVIKSAQKIESVCMRISRIIAGLRSIARDGDNDRFVVVPLRPIVDDALSLSTEKFRHRNIELQVERVPETLMIECRSVQISQILVNLLLNAQHAVESRPGEKWIRLSVLENATTVEIRVMDSGLGIAPDIRDRIFDPFFTTKDVGKGTGLGLSVSAAIAEAHGGALYLDENEVHTTFVLILQKRHAVTMPIATA